MLQPRQGGQRWSMRGLIAPHVVREDFLFLSEQLACGHPHFCGVVGIACTVYQSGGGLGQGSTITMNLVIIIRSSKTPHHITSSTCVRSKYTLLKCGFVLTAMGIIQKK
ncbi:hypothetical protein HELRODRAFT_163779 [Helobdella robusta]|uniref:Uncharacterized protein n=1 Tax=Helobdella robusta TaxID=6412 RepID=T1EUG6_HELRO|nr:hypothetical protein HELRODRAFT_163779 [Helobdella robusta]ESN96680.1 hypothetical protein HELRODRAFT_163779 [Helobdella robusta]